MNNSLKPETLCVQGGWQPKKGEPRVLPIYQSTTFKYDTSEQMARRAKRDAHEIGISAVRGTLEFLHPPAKPDKRCCCSQDRRIGRRRRRHADFLRTGSQFLCRIQYLSGWRPFGLLVHDLRRNVQPVRRDDEKAGHRSDIRRSGRFGRRNIGRFPSEHKGFIR